VKTSPAKRLIKASFNLIGLTVSRMPRGPSSPPRLDQLYQKYKDNTKRGSEEYMTNLALAATVTAPGCVIECGVWKGGSSAGMAEVLGRDREYFLFDSFQGHVDPQPIDGPAAGGSITGFFFLPTPGPVNRRQSTRRRGRIKVLDEIGARARLSRWLIGEKQLRWELPWRLRFFPQSRVPLGLPCCCWC
jgi:hypothetical protein